MYISKIKIRNFRKLENVIIDLEKDTTLFVGANNSGKTSAMTAMSLFLNKQNFSHYDIPLQNYKNINELFESEEIPKIEQFDDIFPTMDLWFFVESDEVHYVGMLLPTLDWTGNFLGIRLRYEIKDITKLYIDYRKARDLVSSRKNMFPKNMMDFLSKRLSDYFEMRVYILDPLKIDINQEQNGLGDALEENPLKNLIKIDVINAQRGMTDEVYDSEQSEKRKLTELMTKYYYEHLNPNKGVRSKEDIDILEKMVESAEVFSDNMRSSFAPVLSELSKIGYPPFGAPAITINPEIRPTETINHKNALQYKVSGELCLPETYNGLGYQNLIFITFKLISFRDRWIKYGKMAGDEGSCVPIHIVLIEEPEAHLHPQAQQVFIRKAYDILTSRQEISDGALSTQLVVSTHSSHIMHECKFKQLRYFKRYLDSSSAFVKAEVVNLTDVFGADKETELFVTRYIKIEHCDLFFADAVILIEGDAERLLMPHFVRKFINLSQAYLSVLTIGGRHAHRLRPLMEKLEIPMLIITDLDSEKKCKNKGKIVYKVAKTKRGKGLVTGNPVLKNWLPNKCSIDDLLNVSDEEKISMESFPLCVVYQTREGERTFEDALKNENKKLVAGVKGDKVGFVLNLLYLENFDELQVPKYIYKGLAWLDDIVKKRLSGNISVNNIENGE